MLVFNIDFAFILQNDRILSGSLFDDNKFVYVSDNGKNVLGSVERGKWEGFVDKEVKVSEYLVRKDVTLSNVSSFEDVVSYLDEKDLEFVALVNEEGEVVNVVGREDVERVRGCSKIGSASVDRKGRFLVGASIGTRDSDKERLRELVNASQGNSIYQIEMIKFAKREFPDLDVIGGNVEVCDVGRGQLSFLLLEHLVAFALKAEQCYACVSNLTIKFNSERVQTLQIEATSLSAQLTLLQVGHRAYLNLDPFYIVEVLETQIASGFGLNLGQRTPRANDSAGSVASGVLQSVGKCLVDTFLGTVKAVLVKARRWCVHGKVHC
ncbi:aldolase-type TIM barrel family protein [Artemisia annua]|uniref:Aldolase-type TIM barrel family protein n=1 Tax=Artemisia annua TaxID=35608 RepID=A0A2U1NKG9_ARTAN|nr:aldolase-type TIM barrel family protein [Artemisia annua]